MTPELVFQNDYYSVVTGESVAQNGVKVYKVINLQYDLIEVETTIMVRALQLARDYGEYLTRMLAEAELDETPPEFDDEDILEFNLPPTTTPDMAIEFVPDPDDPIPA